ncbi:MAG: transposase [Candidatus Marinimicrobia bacterium]|nr:transposase [Candidatus Neomarinimicrobiota bacterium]
MSNRDYGANGWYYVTIKTKKGSHYFGHIQHGRMILNELGRIAQKCWQEIPEHYPFVILDEFVVMPNHIHGIIVIDKCQYDVPVETQDLASLQNRNITPKQIGKFGPQSKNLGAIVRGFKIGVTKYVRKNDIPFDWHPRFHDRVLRIENDELNIKRQYIKNNPMKWGTHND